MIQLEYRLLGAQPNSDFVYIDAKGLSHSFRVDHTGVGLFRTERGFVSASSDWATQHVVAGTPRFYNRADLIPIEIPFNITVTNPLRPPQPRLVPPVAQPPPAAYVVNLAGNWMADGIVKVSISQAGDRSFTATNDRDRGRVYNVFFIADDKVHINCAATGDSYDGLVRKNGLGKLEIALPGDHVWTHE